MLVLALSLEERCWNRKYTQTQMGKGLIICPLLTQSRHFPFCLNDPEQRGPRVKHKRNEHDSADSADSDEPSHIDFAQCATEI